MAKDKPGPWAEILAALAITVLTVGGNLLLIWSQLPSQERDNLKMAWRQQKLSWSRGLSVRAVRAGHAGMGEELRGRDPVPFYNVAGLFARWSRKLENQ